jgi:hypothetical protein
MAMDTRKRAGGMALGLAMALATPGAAQDPSPLGPGVRVRLSMTASRDLLKGTVQALDQNVLSVISDDHQLVKVPRSSITRLETGWGRKGNARKGFIIGGLIGVGGGLLVCATDDDDFFDDFDDNTNLSTCDGAGEWIAIPAVVAATYGGIGALIGHFIKSDRWVELPLHKVRMSIGPSRHGLGLSLSVRF